jgi:hypothetical protein
MPEVLSSIPSTIKNKKVLQKCVNQLFITAIKYPRESKQKGERFALLRSLTGFSPWSLGSLSWSFRRHSTSRQEQMEEASASR